MEENKVVDMGIAYDMPVKIRRFYKKGVRENEIRMTIEMAIVNEDGKRIGSLCSDASGGVVICDDRYQEQWHIDPRQIWDNYIAMRKGVEEEDK